jgi:hypothetical protein
MREKKDWGKEGGLEYEYQEKLKLGYDRKASDVQFIIG